MTADINHNPIEINTPRDPAISLMATVFAKPDLYIAAADAGFRLDHLRRLPSRCRDVMRRFAEAFARTDDWEAVANDFRQADPGFFRWLDAQDPGTVDAEQINALIMEVIAAANGSALNGSTMPGGILSNGHAGPARTHTDKPLPEALTKPGAATPGAEAKAEPLGNDEAEHDAPGAAEAKQSSEYKAQDPEPAEGEQPPSDTEAEPPPSDERGDDDDLAKLSKGAKKALRRAIASMKLGKSDPLKILQAVRAGVVALMKFDLEPGFNAAIAHLRNVARDLYELPVVDIQGQIDGGIQDVLEHRAKPSAGKSDRKSRTDRDVADDQPPPLSEADSDAEIRRLASLSVLQYARQRDDAAKRLGVGLGMIDRLVKAERDKTAGAGTQGRPLSFPQIEPWPDPIDGAALLDDLVVVISKHIVMADYAVHATALWIIHTYLLDVTDITPRLGIMSPEKGCGKSTLLKLLKSLVYRPLLATNVSAPGVFRVVEMMRPTFLIDEADTFLPDNEPLRGILNAGHERGSEIVRPVGEDHVPHLFSTYAACAVAQIGRLPDTIADRSIRIELRRRKPGDRIVELRHGRTGHLDELARRVARWASDNAERVHAIDPAVPPGVFNRTADNWRPLLAIADAAGGDWPECARLACAAAVAGAEDESVKALLLADIRAIFAEKSTDHLSSADLVEALVALEGHPWAEWKGKAITQNGLARLLKPFGISPVKRTYELFQFDDAFERYLPQDPNSQVSKCP